jgi:hypothetical protein
LLSSKTNLEFKPVILAVKNKSLHNKVQYQSNVTGCIPNFIEYRANKIWTFFEQTFKMKISNPE